MSHRSGHSEPAGKCDMNFFSEKLQFNALSDLTRRARGGIVIYLLAWLSITLPTGLHHISPQFFYLNLFILLALLVVRLAHLYCFKKCTAIPEMWLQHWLVLSIVASAIHWGLLSAWVLHQQDLYEIQFYILVTTAVLGTTGTTALAISNQLRFIYPTALIFPVIISLLLIGEKQQMILSVMAVLAYAYVLATSKSAHQDYWSALVNHALADERADELERLSVTDALTGLHNRAYFNQRFIEDWKLFVRLKQPMSLLFIDLDKFKQLNDNYGHPFGDLCLQQISRVISEAVPRESDNVARYGGEEFVVLLPVTNEQGANTVANRILTAVADTTVQDGDISVRLTCSIGGATSNPNLDEDPEQLLKRADDSLYQAKHEGRNRYCADS